MGSISVPSSVAFVLWPHCRYNVSSTTAAIIVVVDGGGGSL